MKYLPLCQPSTIQLWNFYNRYQHLTAQMPFNCTFATRRRVLRAVTRASRTYSSSNVVLLKSLWKNRGSSTATWKSQNGAFSRFCSQCSQEVTGRNQAYQLCERCLQYECASKALQLSKKWIVSYWLVFQLCWPRSNGLQRAKAPRSVQCHCRKTCSLTKKWDCQFNSARPFWVLRSIGRFWRLRYNGKWLYYSKLTCQH